MPDFLGARGEGFKGCIGPFGRRFDVRPTFVSLTRLFSGFRNIFLVRS